jgi:hypothetical protein
VLLEGGEAAAFSVGWDAAVVVEGIMKMGWEIGENSINIYVLYWPFHTPHLDRFV